MNKFLKLLLVVGLPAALFAGATSSPPPWVHTGATNVTAPVMVFALNLPLSTLNTGGDIGTITLPAGFAKWTFSDDQGFSSIGYVTSADATVPAQPSVIRIYTAAGGTGDEVCAQDLSNLAVGVAAAMQADTAGTVETAQVLHVFQSPGSAAGAPGDTVSIFMQILPAN